MKSNSRVLFLTVALCVALVMHAHADPLPAAKELADFLPVGTVVSLIPTSSDKYDIRIGKSDERSSDKNKAARERTQWAIKEAKANTDPAQKARMERLINELQTESIAVSRYKVSISTREFIAFEAVESDSPSWIVLPVSSIHSIRK